MDSSYRILDCLQGLPPHTPPQCSQQNVLGHSSRKHYIVTRGRDQLQKRGAGVGHHRSFPGWGSSQKNGVPSTCKGQRKNPLIHPCRICAQYCSGMIWAVLRSEDRTGAQTSKMKTAWAVWSTFQGKEYSQSSGKTSLNCSK